MRIPVVILLVGLLLSACSRESRSPRTPTEPPPIERNWATWNLDTELLIRERLEGLSLAELRQMRGWIFGKHGRVFVEEDIQSFLDRQSWYVAFPSAKTFPLSGIDRANLDLVRELEAERHEFIELGDLRFWRNRTFSEEKLGDKSLEELRLLQMEMFAIHGASFAHDPTAENYFLERYWYGDWTREESWTPEELQNLATLRDAERKLRGVGALPGEMDKFGEKPLTMDLLDGLSLFELRLLRNEIYARKGRDFRTFWLQQHFRDQPWYVGGQGTKDPPLDAIESESLAAVLRKEDEVRRSLSTSVVDKRMLEGMFREELDKLMHEIHARHGKVFEDKWLQSYFDGQTWYKRNPRYNESMLSEVEKQNLLFIKVQRDTAAEEWKDFHG